MKCPNCNYEISDKEVFKRFASIGGKKSAKSMTKKQRIERAKKAVNTRWKNKSLTSTNK
ncbi:MAG: hypothetical protein PHO75_02320 [Candidatus Shapirobacteria bacterium]|nr:hypothetical protein [Candidatus Shapirobacteria bacterium]